MALAADPQSADVLAAAYRCLPPLPIAVRRPTVEVLPALLKPRGADGAETLEAAADAR